jgi:pimeloyl-ACP methyl ester carboxylesterase
MLEYIAWGLKKSYLRLYHFALWLMMISLLWACAVSDSLSRRQNVIELAVQDGWQLDVIKGSHFNLASFTPKLVLPQSQLVVYIEGDGLAWESRFKVSPDPTPAFAMALLLARKHPSNNAVYLSRPCQYVVGINRRNCEPSVWTSGRFSEQIIRASNDAIDYLKQKYNSKSLILIGYSGGGAVAALVAARRNDVEQLVTIAGNLDHKLWTDLHQISPLMGSLNPTSYRQVLESIPQTHLVGENDKNVPPELIKKYVKGFNIPELVTVKVVEEFDHKCCWVDQWPALLPKQKE